MMRRPILLFLFVQIGIILLLFYKNPLNLAKLMDTESVLTDRAGQVVTVSGTVTNVQVKEFYTALTVKTKNEKIYVKFDYTEDEAELYRLNGKNVELTGTVSIPSKKRNPGGFDYRLYLKGKGIYTIMSVSRFRIKVGSVKRPIANFLYSLKGSFYSKIRPYLDEREFAVLAGILFGDKSYLDDELYEQYQTTGIAHILAVSGLHVSLVYSLIVKITKGKKTLAVNILTVFLLYCYAVISGLSISAVRASVMISLRLLSRHIRRPYDSICAAAFTAILLLLINPYILFDSGFQLSFTAAFSISVIVPFIRSKIKAFAIKKQNNFPEDVGLPLGSGIAISLGMAPLIAFHFLNYSVISIVLNPIAIALAGIILPLGLVCFIASVILKGFPLAILVFPSSAFIRLLSSINSTAQTLKLCGSCIAPPLHALIFYYAVLFWFFSETRIVLNRKRKEKTLLCCALVFIICALVMPKGYDNHSVSFVDVGQGDCIHLNIDGCNILIDGGGAYYKNTGSETIKPYLLKNGIDKIDYAIITHEDMDHSKGIMELSECFTINNIITAGNTNEDCAIISCTIDGVTYLFTSDASKDREEKLIRINNNLKADIVKLGHHGSKTSTSLQYLTSVDPSFALISCGLNNKYGHPSNEVVELLQKTGIIYGRTDYDGAIYVKSVKNGTVLLENAAKDKTWHISIQK